MELADGSSIKVQPNHAFWVDSGPGFFGPGWLEAEHLRAGDQLRTVGGVDVTVIGLRYHVGTADVYTLTVATDHDFFVGSARVLVHNAGPCLPNGFSDIGQFGEFGNIIKQHLGGLVDYYEAYIQGSAATGVNFHTGIAFGPHSDIDLAVVSKELFDAAAAEEGANIRGFSRTAPNPLPEILDPLRQALSTLLGGREVNIVVYATRRAMLARGGGIPVP